MHDNLTDKRSNKGTTTTRVTPGYFILPKSMIKELNILPLIKVHHSKLSIENCNIIRDMIVIINRGKYNSSLILFSFLELLCARI